MLEAAKTIWLGVDVCPPCFAYSHALITAPSINHHPLWRECTTRVPPTLGSKKKVFKYQRCTTATALQLVVDHAFTGSYARRFRPKDPPESLTCKCGAQLRDPNHILRRCPIFHTQRVNAAIHASFHILSLRPYQTTLYLHIFVTLLIVGHILMLATTYLPGMHRAIFMLLRGHRTNSYVRHIHELCQLPHSLKVCEEENSSLS